MIWKRDMYLDYLSGHDVGRAMLCELFGPLKQLEDEWRAQGASEGEISLEAFGFDSVDYEWIPANTSILPQPTAILEENAVHRLLRDEYGRKSELIFGSASIPLPLEYPVETPADWEKIKPRYKFTDARVDREKLALLKKRRDEGALILASMPGGFDEPRQLMGEENLCYALYDEPEMVDDMLSTMAETCLKVFEIVADVCPIDQLFVHEDMAGRSGPLMGPALITRFLKPYYTRVNEALVKQGSRVFSQDSDGNMNPVLDAFLDCGINSMHPFEPQAGMDFVKAKQKYGSRLSVKGGIDKFALRNGREAIVKELSYKIRPETVHGGVVFGLDHRIPNGVSLADYRFYVQTAREMLNLEPMHPEKHVRMAF